MVWEEMLFQEFQEGCHGHHVAMVSKSYNVAKHVVCLIGFTDITNQWSDYTGKKNGS